jgi:hypothetical protein
MDVNTVKKWARDPLVMFRYTRGNTGTWLHKITLISTGQGVILSRD